MSEPLQIKVYDNHRLMFSSELAGPVELGRQIQGETAPYSQTLQSGRWRVVIAKLDENTVSRRHAQVVLLSEGRVRLTNLSSTLPVYLPDGSELKAKTSCELPIPAILILGGKTIQVEPPEPEDIELQSLIEATMRPGQRPPDSTRLTPLKLPELTGTQVESVVRWLQTTMEVLQSATSSSDFFQRAAQAVVDIVGLDTGRVLILKEGRWEVESLRTADHADQQSGQLTSSRVLTQVRNQKRTFWQVPDESAAELASLAGVQAVVAAPILDRQGEVIGVLYGDRLHKSGAGWAQITKLEAMLVELLACGVAAGLARLEQEQAALAARVQFEQFFTPELSRLLTSQPDLLKGQDAEVTILFCDIRRFSRISERVGPARTVDWISDVLGALSDCVISHRGVLVDYTGDELLAMWGAPEQQPDHAKLACRAALDMRAKLPELDQRWHPVVQEPMGLGIGINTGVARVGNIGSHRKFKYGPLGNTVNLASRVQGATKYLKSGVLITESTQARLDGSFLTRKLCQVRVVNIDQPVYLYELAAGGQPGWSDLKQGYEKALGEFEGERFRVAAQIVGNLLAQFPDDGPLLVLLSRAVNSMVDPSEYHAVWELPGK